MIEYQKCSNDVCLLCDVNKTVTELRWMNEITRQIIAFEAFYVASKERGTLNDCHGSLYSVRLYQPCGQRKHGNYTCRNGDNVLQTYLLYEGK